MTSCTTPIKSLGVIYSASPADFTVFKATSPALSIDTTSIEPSCESVDAERYYMSPSRAPFSSTPSTDEKVHVTFETFRKTYATAPCIGAEDVESPLTKQTLKRYLRDWKTAAEVRKSYFRAHKQKIVQQMGALEEHLSECEDSEKKEIEEQVLRLKQSIVDLEIKSSKDAAVINEYKELCSSMINTIDRQLSPTADTPTAQLEKKFRVITDKDGNCQCIAMYSITAVSSLYLDFMVTSAHNLRLYAPFDEDFTPFRGAGTIMMHSLYTTAIEEDLDYLQLKPAGESSHDFYNNLKMTLAKEEGPEYLRDCFFYDLRDPSAACVLQGKIASFVSSYH